MANSAVRKILTRCYSCRRQQAAFCEQKMANLPEDRLFQEDPHLQLLTVNCFGPFQIWSYLYI